MFLAMDTSETGFDDDYLDEDYFDEGASLDDEDEDLTVSERIQRGDFDV